MPAMASDLTLHDSHARELPLPLAQLYRQAYNALDVEERHRHAFDLWDWSLRLLGATCVVEYQARGAVGAPVGDLLARIDRLTLGSWWRLVCVLLEFLSADDDEFRKVHEVLLKKSQRGMARAAALHVELIRALGGSAGPRAVVNLRELIDCLINYRNRKIGHPDEMRSGELFAKIGPALLGGAIDLFEHVDVLAGRKLTYIADVRQDAGRWRIVTVRLTGVACGAAETHYRPLSAADRLPNAGETYLESPGGELRSIGMLASFDAATQQFAFRPAAPPTPSETVLPARLDPVADDGPQQCSFDDFQLLTRLGAGGAGAVFRARQLSVDRDVALKCVLRPDPAAEQRFLREVAALGRVSHPNLARIFAYGAAGVQCYYAMELVEGADLARIMQHLIRGANGEVDANEWVHAVTTACEHARAAETKLDSESDAQAMPEPTPTPPPDLRAGPHYIRQVVTLMAQVADAAHALHEAQPQGIIHRDIKPSNIVVAPDGERAVLVDLGLALLPDEASDRAKLTRTRQFVGTARYASPEQIFDAHRVDRRTDVYSLGATLWELLALRPLFGGAGDDPSFDRALAVAVSIRTHNRRVPADLDAVVRKCLAPDKTKRYSSAAEFAADLRRWLAGEPVTAQPPTLRYIWGLHVRKHKWKVAAGIALLVALVAGTIGGFAVLEQQRQKEIAANKEKAEALEREQKINEELSARNKALQHFNDITYRLFGGAKVGKNEDARTLYRTLAVQAVRNSVDQGDMDSAFGLMELLIEREDESYALELSPLLTELCDKKPDDARLRAMLGACHSLLKHWDEADHCFDTALRLNPNQAAAFGWRAFSKLNRKQFDLAIADYSEAIRLDPLNPARWNARGNVYYSHKSDYPKAIADYSEAIRLKPTDTTYLTNRGNAYARAEEYDKALADYTESIRIDPKNPAVWNGRGTCLHNDKHDYARAVEDYSEAIRLAPSIDLYRANRANSYRLLRDYERALMDYTEAIRLRNDEPSHYSGRARTCYDKGDYAAAIADYDVAIRLAPERADLWNVRAVCRDQLQQYDAAIADFTEAIRRQSESVYYANRGNAQLRKGDLDAALADYTEAIRLEPKNAFRYSLRAAAHQQKKDTAAAIADFTQAVTLAPGEAIYWAERGDAHAAAGQIDRALADHAKAIELEPQNPVRWNNRGVVLETVKLDFPAAIADYSEAIRLRPKTGLYFSNRGNAYLRAKDVDKALTDYSQAIALEPKEDAWWNKRGNAYFNHKEDFARAAADYSEAIRLKPTVALYWSNRADCFRRLKDYPRALDDYREAIRLEPKNPNHHNERGIVNHDAQRFADAIADYSNAIALAPNDPVYLANRALAYKNLREYDKAIADYEAAIRGDPQAARRRRDLADARILKGDFTGAIQDLTEAIRLEPNNPHWHAARADVYRERQRDYPRAIADFSAAIKLRPGDAAYYMKRGLCYSARGEYDSAAADYTASLKIDPKQPAALHRRGYARVQLRQFAAAQADFDESLKLDRTNHLCWNDRGNLFHNHLKDYPRAIADYSEAILLKPDDPVYWSNRAGSLLAIQDIDGALADYSQAVRFNPKDHFSWNARGNLYHKHKRDYVKAVADFAEAIKLSPKSAVYLTNRGNSYTELGENAKALADYSAAISVDPKNVDALWNRAWLQKNRFGNNAQASADYEAAITVNPNTTEALYLYAWHLATCPDAQFRDGRRAVELAARANSLTNGRIGAYLDTLSAAFAEIGDFDRAILWIRSAQAVSASAEERQRFSLRERQYQMRQPVRAP